MSQPQSEIAPPEPRKFTRRLKDQAAALGFDAVGVCPAVTPQGLHRFAQWLAAGYAGEMTFLHELAHAHEHPYFVLEGARSLVVLTMNYRTQEPLAPQAGMGRVSRYAWGEDYHDLAHRRLKELQQWFQTEDPGAAVRGVVDSAPLMEREFARLAGLGWIGKHSLLLNREHGSWFFLSVLLTDRELAYDEPTTVDHCGTCTACLDACPTDAFVQSYVLDARRCISYLTIEHRSAIPHDLRAGLGDWIFGCDVCQDVCPWNNRAPVTTEPHFQPQRAGELSDLCELLALDETEFRQRFRGTPLMRTRRRGLLRNAAIVLGNQRHAAAVPALVGVLADDEPLIRGAAAWALGQIGGAPALQALQERQPVETDADVQAELQAALAVLEGK